MDGDQLKGISAGRIKEVSARKKVRSPRHDEDQIAYSKFVKNGLIWTTIGVALFLIFYLFIYMDYGLGVFFVGIAAFGLLQIVAGLISKRNSVSGGLVVVMNDLFKMPKTMVQLAYVQFFSWFALFAMWIYTTPAVTHHIYGANRRRFGII